MNDTAIKNFCMWARRELMARVSLQAARFGIRENGYDPALADVVSGRPLSVVERRQRADLIRRLGPADGAGYGEAYEALVDAAAYTWFNRLIAIRFMELNDRLPSHVRMLSAEDGSFAPQVLREALDVPIEGLDAAQVSALVAASDDEKLFRYLFLAQCRELATCLPDVFEPVGAAMELLLPEGLLRRGSVVQRLVDDIPEEDWREGVEIVGWMYQYYVSERKDEVFASFKKGKKADAGAIAPATQLFTPHWIVRYLTENSLGRLWMQAHPDSRLTEQMPYYIPDDLGAEGALDAVREEGAARDAAPTGPVGDGFGRPAHPASTPEAIKVIDPACGSGHILVYAFKLLAAMYEEAGHVRRDIPRLILQNNLTGCEIDPRAAQMASFALAMTACEWDSRFLRRTDKVSARIVCLKPAELAEEELEEMPYLAERTALLDAMAHMGECGSLFVPEPEDLAALEQADDELDAREAGGDLLAYHPHAAVTQMLANCEPLAETYDAVIANPPYMGSSNMDKWLANWTKKHYPDSKRDLCTCFIERGFTLAKPEGYSAMVTMESWMFLGSYEKLRERILTEKSIASLVYMNHMVMRIAFNTSATVFKNTKSVIPGSYTRVEYTDLNRQGVPIEFPVSRHGLYRRSSDSFKSIPGTPIAYWASDALLSAFSNAELAKSFAEFKQGLASGCDEEFVRQWWEVSQCLSGYSHPSENSVSASVVKWVPFNKGGSYRKWYGNNDVVIAFDECSRSILQGQGNHLPSRRYYFRPSITWSKVTSGPISFRYKPVGHTFGVAGGGVYGSEENLRYLQGVFNSSCIELVASMLSPTLNYEVGQVATYPILCDETGRQAIAELVEELRSMSKDDWDSSETSWEFKVHPMIV
ncbi:MAG: BREX-1 system adenine-specific DNA-methyltransferase PglX [Adlercreutzia mucosicola]|nr:BREX-1 system adenine-specific DNA-methyltransferase PglX [Adlercreutzia mucosicola]